MQESGSRKRYRSTRSRSRSSSCATDDASPKMEDSDKNSPVEDGCTRASDDTVSPPPLDQIPDPENSTIGGQWMDSKCVFCSDDLRETAEPKLLPCLHTSCKACLTDSASNAAPTTNALGVTTKQIICPSCNQEINVEEAIDHLFLLEHLSQNSEGIQEESKSYACTSCEESADATGFCNDCQEWLCDTCVNAHHRVRVTKDHTIRPKEEMEGEKPIGLNQKYLFCPIHSHEPLKVYCETCDKLTCRDCQLSDHKNHKYQFLLKACEEEKNQIGSLLDKIKEKQQHIGTACDLVNQRHGEITQREQIVSQEIKRFAVRFIAEINKRGKQLLQELADVCSSKKTQLSLKNQELINISERLDYCLKFAEAALASGSETALVYSRKLIFNQLRRIMKHRCEVPNPQHTVDICFSYEATFLSQYISSLGCLLVDQVPVPQPNTQQVLQHTNANQIAAKNTPVLQQSLNHQGNQQIMSSRPPSMNVPQHVSQLRQKAPQAGQYGQPQVTSSTDPAHNNRGPNVSRQMVNPTMPTQHRAQMSRMPMNQNYNLASNNSYMTQRHVVPQSSPIRQGTPQIASAPLRQQMAQLTPQRVQPAQVTPIRQQPVPPPQPSYQQHQTSAVPASLIQNSDITISPVGGPPPAKQRAVAGRPSNQIPNITTTPVSNNTNQRVASGANANGSLRQATEVSETFGILPANREFTKSVKFQSMPPENENVQLSVLQVSESLRSQVTLSQFNSSLQENGSHADISSTCNSTNLLAKASQDSRNEDSDPESRIERFSSVSDKLLTVNALLKHYEITNAPNQAKKPKSPSTEDKLGQELESHDDLCAVCREGGDLLMCDSCPKVFHLRCHVPCMSSVPKGDWVCRICENIYDGPFEVQGSRRKPSSISGRDLMVCEKILLKLLCHENSVPFHAPVSKNIQSYYKFIRKPTDLSRIKMKLAANHFEPFKSVMEFVQEFKLMINNCITYNKKNTPLYYAALRLDQFFDELYQKVTSKK